MKIDKYIKNYIDGSLMPSDNGEYMDNLNPATGEFLNFVPASNANDVQRAVEAAERAFPKWSTGGRRMRFRILNRIADIIEQELESFARAETTDTGKPFSMSITTDIPNAQSNIRFFASALLHQKSDTHLLEKEAVHYALKQPIGVVGCMSPWNMPLYFFTWKIAPALAAGNCVVAKPSEMAPMTAYLLSKACIEAGLPAGVLNIVHGAGSLVGKAIAEHPKIKAISFTGSTATGREIARAAAPMFKKLNLQLGGKNPNIIFADCDFDKMIVETLRSSFSNNGQLCWSASKILIERPIYEQFKEEFVKRTQFLKVGDPNSPVTDLGALISLEQQEKIMSYIALAEMEGGTVLCGGTKMEMNGIFENGFYLRPAVIEGLAHNSRTNLEEIFGPVVTIMPFDTEAEALEYANVSEYGLCATIWTKDLERANRMATQLQVGMVWMNTWHIHDHRQSYGGIGTSGNSREGGMSALDFFTNNKSLTVAMR